MPPSSQPKGKRKRERDSIGGPPPITPQDYTPSHQPTLNETEEADEAYDGPAIDDRDRLDSLTRDKLVLVLNASVRAPHQLKLTLGRKIDCKKLTHLTSCLGPMQDGSFALHPRPGGRHPAQTDPTTPNTPLARLRIPNHNPSPHPRQYSTAHIELLPCEPSEIPS